MDDLSPYHFVLPIVFDTKWSLQVFDEIRDKKIIMQDSEDLGHQLEIVQDCLWIQSGLIYNRSVLLHSANLYKSHPDFCASVLEQLWDWIPGPKYVQQIAFIQTPLLGISPHRDYGKYRKAGINIGLLNTKDYVIKYGPDNNIDPETFYSNCRSFVLKDGEAHIINVGNAHAVDPIDPMPTRRRLLLSYSFHQEYQQILEELKCTKTS
jgi:hypothetical protein